MGNKGFLRTKFVLINLLILLFFTTACEEDPIAPQDEHIDAIGMVFYSSGIEVARILKGVTEDTLYAPLGGLSDHLDIKFLSEDGLEFDPPATAETQSLDWEFDDNSICDIWQHEGEEGYFAFHLQGLKVGNTEVEFFAMHNDHSDYRSGKIQVKVESQESTYGIPIGLELEDEESGNILVAINNQQVVGQLSLNSTDTTDHMVVTFFDNNNVHFQPASPPHTLLVEVADKSIISITGLEEDEPWAFKIAGLKSGSTTVTIKLLHDGNVGVAFVPITVNVN
jgi:hypothetical protein